MNRTRMSKTTYVFFCLAFCSHVLEMRNLLEKFSFYTRLHVKVMRALRLLSKALESTPTIDNYITVDIFVRRCPKNMSWFPEQFFNLFQLSYTHHHNWLLIRRRQGYVYQSFVLHMGSL